MINKFNSVLIVCGNIGYERKILNNKLSSHFEALMKSKFLKLIAVAEKKK